MKFFKYVMSFAIAVGLTACGGGGGNPGTSSTSTGTTPTAPSTPKITLTIVDSADAVVTSNAIGSGALFYAKAIVKDANGTAVTNKLVTFITSATVATLAQGSALTDANGAAKIQITPVSLTAVAAGNLSATATVNAVPVSADLDYQTSAANVSLTNLLATPNAINALQSSGVTVEGRVNGVLAGSSVVAVNFVASCGTFSPASAPTNSSGIASTIYQSAVTCSGPVTVTAQATGAVAVSTTVTVAAAKAANVVFSSASVPLMVSSGASGGLKQSTLKFQVLDSSGTGMSGQSLNITLGNSTINAGVTFSVGGVATALAQNVTTDGSGFASVTVTSGSLPTPVVVTAALVSSPAIQAASSGVAVTSGRATQNAASLSASKLSIEAFRIDGVQTTLTMRVADRQGNPVPAGALVNFVASHGLVQGTCAIDNSSQCNVLYTSQGLRPTNGRVAILAYMDGEESFVDANGDNIWQPGETFYDVGTLYRDDNENAVYDAGSEQSYPGGAVGTSACAASTFAYPSVANSCDGTWSSNIRVRQQIIIALATSDASIVLQGTKALSGFSVKVTDTNGNSMPTGTTVNAVVATSGATCRVLSISPSLVRNSSNGGNHSVRLDAAADCLTARVDVTVTTPAGLTTTIGF